MAAGDSSRAGAAQPGAVRPAEAAIERFSAAEGLRSLVVPVSDTAHTDRFAEVTLKNVEATVAP